jgi:uncharacterized ion transporter superfamily protein YfcC
MWFAIVGAAIAYVLRYAYRVRSDASHSVLGAQGVTGGGLKMADEAGGSHCMTCPIERDAAY